MNARAAAIWIDVPTLGYDIDKTADNSAKRSISSTVRIRPLAARGRMPLALEMCSGRGHRGVHITADTAAISVSGRPVVGFSSMNVPATLPAADR